MAGPWWGAQSASIGRPQIVFFWQALTRTGGATMNNTIQVIGYVGQNPHAISFGDTGNKVVKFSVAVKEFSSNTDENKTLWIDVDAWNGLGDRVLKVITKGREVAVHGRLALSTFNKEVNGVKVEMTKPVIKLTSFHLCGKKPSTNGDADSEHTEVSAAKKGRLAAVKG
jgi:single-strand DNA-binding protein